ncbi:MAG: sigma-70 family RNA polymerase sigma factor [Christensenellaceae bacterium]|jgi:RNA polymerase sporulation-specific sigma factor|nr:sigma-70 family RNA polymerase sigma factor [Christensenellaceae bacterium]
MLLPGEILELINKSQCGCENAKSEVVMCNMPLIKSIVNRYRNRHVEYEDLIQLGTLGLIKAINNFDISYGVQFSTYAVPLIIGEIKRFLRDDGSIKVSRAVKTQYTKINRYISDFRNRENREATLVDISNEFKLDESEIVFILESAKYPISIYTENDDEGLTVCDRIADKTTTEDVIDRLMLKELIEKLPERDKKIIMLRYFRDKTQGEVAIELNVSQVQISRLENKIIERMRDAFSHGENKH